MDADENAVPSTPNEAVNTLSRPSVPIGLRGPLNPSVAKAGDPGNDNPKSATSICSAVVSPVTVTLPGVTTVVLPLVYPMLGTLALFKAVKIAVALPMAEVGIGGLPGGLGIFFVIGTVTVFVVPSGRVTKRTTLPSAPGAPGVMVPARRAEASVVTKRRPYAKRRIRRES